jgi:hypothetical protein
MFLSVLVSSMMSIASTLANHWAVGGSSCLVYMSNRSDWCFNVLIWKLEPQCDQGEAVHAKSCTKRSQEGNFFIAEELIIIYNHMPLYYLKKKKYRL